MTDVIAVPLAVYVYGFAIPVLESLNQSLSDNSFKSLGSKED
jgi:hypothetical protein